MNSLISQHGAAMRLMLTDRQVSRLVRRNEIPVVRLPNGEVRFDPTALASWVRSLSREPVTTNDSGHTHTGATL